MSCRLVGLASEGIPAADDAPSCVCQRVRRLVGHVGRARIRAISGLDQSTVPGIRPRVDHRHPAPLEGPQVAGRNGGSPRWCDGSDLSIGLRHGSACPAAACEDSANATAAGPSNGRMRPVKSSAGMVPMAAASAVRRRPNGIRATPRQSSASVMAEVNKVAPGWLSSHLSTRMSGRGAAPRKTFVSRTIIRPGTAAYVWAHGECGAGPLHRAVPF